MSADSSLSKWLNYLDQRGKSPHTLAAYRRAVNHFIKWDRATYGQGFDPARVIPRDVRDWKSHQQTTQRAAPTTINQRLSALSKYFEWCIIQGIREDNPVAEINGLSLPTIRPKALSRADERRFVREAHAGRDRRDIAIIELLLATGIRVDELLSLRVGDVVTRERSGLVIVREGKGGNYREIPLAIDARKAADRYKAAGHPDPGNPDSALFHGQRGPLKDRSAVYRMLGVYAQLAKLDKFGPHVLRHTFAVRYLERRRKEGDTDALILRDLAYLLGHKDIKTMMIYTAPTLDDLVKRVE